MKFFWKLLYRTVYFLIFAAFLISCFTQYISPSKFSFITVFCVAFPYLFLAVIILAVVTFFINRRIAICFALGSILFGYINLRSTIAFHFPSKFNIQKNDSSLRIMTWNVEDFVNLLQVSEVRSNMLQLISQNNSDILCVQEFTNVEGARWRVSVRKELDSLGYRYYLFSNDQVSTNPLEKTVMRGTAIFSKKPFADTGLFNVRKKTMNENALYATVMLNNKPLRIYTMHLASFSLYNDTVATSKTDIYKITYDRKRAIQYKLRETEELHEEEVKIIRDSILKSPYPVICCGDMNTTPCSYNYRILKNNFQDAFLAKGSGIGATFYKILPTLRIDVFFAADAFKIDQCNVIQRKLSDHYPVITDVSWK